LLVLAQGLQLRVEKESKEKEKKRKRKKEKAEAVWESVGRVPLKEMRGSGKGQSESKPQEAENGGKEGTWRTSGPN
jgi:hypothetical protein